MSIKPEILIIDDETLHLQQFCRILTYEGFSVEGVQSGEIALQKMHFKKYNIVIVDLILEKDKMSGFETIKKIYHKNLDIYIIATSAHASTENAVQLILSENAQNYIQKPYNDRDLVQTVKSGIKWLKHNHYKLQNELTNNLKRQNNNRIIKRCYLTGVPYCPRDIHQDENTVFVGMPFKADFDKIFYSAIEPAIKELNMEPWRADLKFDNIILICKICQGIQESIYVLVDITEFNPNVFFELGLALGLSKKTLILKKDRVIVPTDLRGFEYIEYNDNLDSLKNKIKQYLENFCKKEI